MKTAKAPNPSSPSRALSVNITPQHHHPADPRNPRPDVFPSPSSSSSLAPRDLSDRAGPSRLPVPPRSISAAVPTAPSHPFTKDLTSFLRAHEGGSLVSIAPTLIDAGIRDMDALVALLAIRQESREQFLQRIGVGPIHRMNLRLVVAKLEARMKQVD